MSAILDQITSYISCSPPWGLCPHPLVLIASLAAPHFLYAYIWFQPKQWMKMFKSDPVDAFALAGLIGKVLQFGMLILWIACSREDGICLDFSRVSLLQWLSSLVLVGYGQSLNVGIFKAIGHVGVYYGFKLGHKVPWVHGWPFDAVAHPQYVGSVLSVWGAVALLWNQMHLPSLLLVATYWTLLYVITGLQEQYL